MSVKAIMSTLENGEIVQRVRNLMFAEDAEGIEKGVVNLYPQMTFQTFNGFGGALTEAAGYVYGRMDSQAQARLTEAYYGKDGLGYRVARTHIDSCDFSLGNYSAVSDPDDTELATFSLDRDERYILPLIRAAERCAGQPLEVMLTPWSPPPFMKTNGRKNGGGTLKEAYYPLWARYIRKYVEQYRALGIRVTMLSPQNEPKAAQTWDSCVFSAEQERRFVRDHLAPELRRAGLEDVALIIWDHNKERAFDRACAVMRDAETEALVSGVGVHWYSGDHFEALSLIRERFPGKRIIFTEACVEYSVHGDGPPLRNAQMYAHDIIGDLNAGTDTFLDWNILLDARGGPNHVGNFCEAPIMWDEASGALKINPSYHYIGHFSRHIARGAVRIGLSRFSDALEVTAFENPGGGIAAVVLNRGGENTDYVLRLEGRVCPLTAQAESLTTLIIG